MTSTDGKLIISVLIYLVMLDIVCVYGTIKIKEENARFYPISDVTSELVDQDLVVGLRSLSSTELKTLSEYIDDESETTKSDAFEDVADAYNRDDSLSGDLFGKLPNENVGLNTGSEIRNNGLKRPENGKIMDKDGTIRTKRNSSEDSGANLVDMEEYVKELENSFPRSQQEYFNDTDEVGKEHIRVKRL